MVTQIVFKNYQTNIYSEEMDCRFWPKMELTKQLKDILFLAMVQNKRIILKRCKRDARRSDGTFNFNIKNWPDVFIYVIGSDEWWK